MITADIAEKNCSFPDGALLKSEKREKNIETEWKCLRHNNTGSTIKTRVTVYSCYCISEPYSYLHGNSSYAQGSMIHLLIELYGNCGEDSETKWK